MQLRDDWHDHVYWPFDNQVTRLGQRSVSAVLGGTGVLALVAAVMVAALYLGILPPPGQEMTMIAGH